MQQDGALSFMILDLKTKEYKVITPPLSYFANVPSGGLVSMGIECINRYVDVEGNVGFGILYTTGDLFAYYPGVGIDDTEKTDEGIFQEIGVRNIYPNPVVQTATAEIMCYVQYPTKLDIELYNLFGQKILDLNNNFEYSESNHTIYTTFKIPKETPGHLLLKCPQWNRIQNQSNSSRKVKFDIYHPTTTTNGVYEMTIQIIYALLLILESEYYSVNSILRFPIISPLQIHTLIPMIP